jgi:hypothetical protein
MGKGVSSLMAKPGRWVADERTYAAMYISMPETDARVKVSVTMLDSGPSPVCTLAVECERPERVLELMAALRVTHDGPGEPDLAMYLTDVIKTIAFRRKVLAPFVARMQECGMF